MAGGGRKGERSVGQGGHVEGAQRGQEPEHGGGARKAEPSTVGVLRCSTSNSRVIVCFCGDLWGPSSGTY